MGGGRVVVFVVETTDVWHPSRKSASRCESCNPSITMLGRLARLKLRRKSKEDMHLSFLFRPCRFSTLLCLFALIQFCAYDGAAFQVHSSVPSGAYNVPQDVILTTDRRAPIYYTLDGTEPSPPRGSLYLAPITFRTSGTLRAMSISGGVPSDPLEVKISILERPTSTEQRRLRIVHRDPIYENITRIAFLNGETNAESVVFSTLESYHRNPNGDEFLLYRYDLGSTRTNTLLIKSSIEARSYAFCEALGRYVLGVGLEPQVILYDAAQHRIEPVFHAVGVGAWIHGIAAHGTYAYTILSTPSTSVRGFEGILRLNLLTKQWEIIPFADKRPQNWGAVQSVDPSGRIWFYRAYPFSPRWYDDRSNERERKLAGYENWTVEGWDRWGTECFVVLANKERQLLKKQVDIHTLSVIETPEDADNEDRRLFLSLIPVDLFHQGGPSTANLYYRPTNSGFYLVDSAKRVISFLGRMELGAFEVSGFVNDTVEVPARWTHPQFGPINLLGRDRLGRLLFWLGGQKAYLEVDLSEGRLLLKKIHAPNLSPADVSAMELGSDGFIYGGGVLSSCDMFKFDPDRGSVQVLPEAIPHHEGQVSWLFTGHDGMIYGAAYPDSVLFRYDPRMAWNPGRAPGSNPLNLGPMGHHKQMRPSHGVQDLDGNVWFRSNGDYYDPIVSALAKANFMSRTLVVKTDLEDQFPVVEKLAVFDNKHLLLLGHENKVYYLYLLNQENFSIELRKPLERAGGELLTAFPKDPVRRKTYLLKDGFVYLLHKDLHLQPLHRSGGTVVKMLLNDDGGAILIGKSYAEMFDNQKGKWEVWWDKPDLPGSYLFRHLAYIPVLFHRGALYMADEEKLMVLPSPLSLGNVRRTPTGSFQFTLNSEISGPVRVDVSTNLVDWSSLFGLTTIPGEQKVVDAGAVTRAQSYYRAVSTVREE